MSFLWGSHTVQPDERLGWGESRFPSSVSSKDSDVTRSKVDGRGDGTDPAVASSSVYPPPHSEACDAPGGCRPHSSALNVLVNPAERCSFMRNAEFIGQVGSDWGEKVAPLIEADSSWDHVRIRETSSSKDFIIRMRQEVIAVKLRMSSTSSNTTVSNQ